MNVLILGNSEINTAVESCLAADGLSSITIYDAAEVLKFSGEPGAYKVTTKEGEYYFTSILVTEPRRYSALEADGEATICLMDVEAVERLSGIKRDEKIVFLLDYMAETAEYITEKAIDIASRLARQKKDVVFLSKAVKTGYDGGEQKYYEARNAGVSFFKYERATLGYDEEADVFTIEAGDGAADIEVMSPFVLSAIGKETPELTGIIKKLNLYKKSGDGINEDKFFMNKVFTSRLGVYYLNPAMITLDKEKSVERAMAKVMADMKAMARREAALSTAEAGWQPEVVRGRLFPEVDAGKCAFCYSCYRACAHGALAPDLEASAMKVVEPLCQACGTCIAICPGEAISRKVIGGEGETENPRRESGGCKIYCCENGASEALDEAISLLGKNARFITKMAVTCGGSVSVDMMTNDLAGYNIVVVACCPEGACRHMDGDRRALRQVERTAELIQKAGLTGKRVELIKVSHTMVYAIRDEILRILEGQI